MKELLIKFVSAMLAGLCISVGCVVNLQVGGVAGAVLFTFGLITVVHYKYALFTGTAGFIASWREFAELFLIILIGNFVGCMLTALLADLAIPDLMDKAAVMSDAREGATAHGVFLRAMFCGFLMTTAVKFAREGRWLPLIFAVPVFILAGFYHSIADAFYLNAAWQWTPKLALNYTLIVLGNFVGCNIYRARPEKD